MTRFKIDWEGGGDGCTDGERESIQTVGFNGPTFEQGIPAALAESEQQPVEMQMS